MKKIYAIITVLVLLSCCVFGLVTTTVNAERNQVTITEKIIYGDKSAAEGLEITTVNHLNYRLYWKTDYTIGNDSLTKTDFSFYPRQFFGKQTERRYEGIQLDDGIEYGFYDDSPLSKQSGIQKAYKELFDTAENGEEKTKKVYLKDYYDYYPLGIGFDLPHTNWYRYDGENLKGEPYDALYVTEKFREYFKIPVLDSDTLTISVEKGEDGNSYSTGVDEMGMFQLYAIGTVARSNNRCFFSINNRKYVNTENNNYNEVEYIDTSMISGGYGIYSFYYCGGDSASRTGILADRIETVFPLDSKSEVTHISLNEDETKLLLFTVENNFFYLTVIDIETMTAIQKIQINGTKGMGTVYEYDDFIVADTGECISVISIANGTYNLDFTAKKASFIDETFQDIWNADCMDYKDGKLVLIANTFDKETGYEVCDFDVSVYDKSGLVFYGIYDNSLDFDRLNNSFSYDCHPADINPNTIKWK